MKINLIRRKSAKELAEWLAGCSLADLMDAIERARNYKRKDDSLNSLGWEVYWAKVAKAARKELSVRRNTIKFPEVL